MDGNVKYDSEWWEGREVLPGHAMRFTDAPRTSKALRRSEPRLGTSFARTIRPRRGWRDRGFDEQPRTVADALIGKSDRRTFGATLDKMNKLTRRKGRRKVKR